MKYKKIIWSVFNLWYFSYVVIVQLNAMCYLHNFFYIHKKCSWSPLIQQTYFKYYFKAIIVRAVGNTRRRWTAALAYVMAQQNKPRWEFEETFWCGGYLFWTCVHCIAVYMNTIMPNRFSCSSHVVVVTRAT